MINATQFLLVLKKEYNSWADYDNDDNDDDDDEQAPWTASADVGVKRRHGEDPESVQGGFCRPGYLSQYPLMVTMIIITNHQ